MEEYGQKALSKSLRFAGIMAGVCVIIWLALMLLWGPVMRPWTQERTGLANLKRASYENMIRAEQAAAESEASVHRAKAINIVGSVAKEFPEYRAQEFIGGFAGALESGKIAQTFYVATRGGLPVLPSVANTAVIEE